MPLPQQPGVSIRSCFRHGSSGKVIRSSSTLEFSQDIVMTDDAAGGAAVTINREAVNISKPHNIYHDMEYVTADVQTAQLNVQRVRGEAYEAEGERDVLLHVCDRLAKRQRALQNQAGDVLNRALVKQSGQVQDLLGRLTVTQQEADEAAQRVTEELQAKHDQLVKDVTNEYQVLIEDQLGYDFLSSGCLHIPSFVLPGPPLV